MNSTLPAPTRTIRGMLAPRDRALVRRRHPDVRTSYPRARTGPDGSPRVGAEDDGHRDRPADRPDPRPAGLRLGARDVRRPRARSSPEPAPGAPAGRPDDGDLRRDGRVQAGGRPRARRRSRPASCSIPRSGRPSAIVDGSLPAGSGLLVAIEATGYDGPSTARMSRVLDGWSVAKAKRMGATAAKLLVYYHPDAANAADQERLVADVAADCARPIWPCSSSRCRSRSTRPSRGSRASGAGGSSSRPPGG